jgi:hypothetical protein
MHYIDEVIYGPLAMAPVANPRSFRAVLCERRAMLACLLLWWVGGSQRLSVYHRRSRPCKHNGAMCSCTSVALYCVSMGVCAWMHIRLPGTISDHVDVDVGLWGEWRTAVNVTVHTAVNGSTEQETVISGALAECRLHIFRTLASSLSCTAQTISTTTVG